MNRSSLRSTLCALLLLPVPAVARAALFDSPVTATTCNKTGLGPFGVRAADFNSDGLADIATSNQFDGTISILLGQGGGSFAAHVDYQVGLSPLSLVVADFNGDGRLDVATANFDGNSVSILLGRGDGTFNSKIDMYVGGGPRSVAAGDFNSDGLVDVVVARSLFADVAVLLGDGHGSIQSISSVPTGANPRWVEVNDLNGDGKKDLTVSNTDASTISVLLGAGDGTFPTKTDYLVIGNALPRGHTVADLNGDGRLDIVSTTANGYLSIFYGVGGGAFGQRSDVFVGVGSSVSVAVGDLNHDGRKDIVTCYLFDGGFSILLANPFGGFQQPTFHPGTGFSAREIALADLNQDGHLDAVTDDYDYSYVRLAFGNGFGGFTDPPLPPPPPSYVIDSGGPFGSFGSQDALAAGDLNEDGNPDLVNSHLSYDNGFNLTFQVSMLVGSADGSFQAGVRVIDLQTKTKLKEVQLRSDVALVDLNGDGHLDIAASCSELDAVAVALGRGDGTFGSAKTYATNVNPQRLAIGDLNGDGRPDLALTCTNGTVAMLIGKGDGTFKGKTSYGVGKSPVVLAIGDVNLDGRQDLVVGNQDFDNKGVFVGTIWLLQGNGNGGFKDRVQVTTGVFSNGIALRDLNGDGRLDLIVESGQLSVFLGRGDGTFGARNDYPTSSQLFLGKFVLDDLNGDGKLDVAMPTSACAFGTVEVLLGNGDGSFGLGTPYFAGMSAGAVTSADLNHDGRKDLAVVVSGTGLDRVAILLNRGGAANAAAAAAVSGSDASSGAPSTFGARVSPLPVHGEGTLHFTLTRPGAVRIALYDLSGRKVRKLLDQPWMAAGVQPVRLDGRDETGGTLAAGLYFYRIVSPEGTLKGQFILAR